jgi:hypothetical protein
VLASLPRPASGTQEGPETATPWSRGSDFVNPQPYHFDYQDFLRLPGTSPLKKGGQAPRFPLALPSSAFTLLMED